MIKRIEILDENESGTLLIERNGLTVTFGSSLFKKNIKLELSKLKKMISQGQTSYSKLWLDCYERSIDFKIPDNLGIRMGIRKDFSVIKLDQPKKDYIFIEAQMKKGSHTFSLIFEIEEVKSALA